MAKIYITQVPHKRDRETGALTPTVNINPANEHGELVVMMPPRASFYNIADTIRQLREHLKKYDYLAGDALLALGDPCIIGAAAAILAQSKGPFKMLKWERNLGRYLPVEIKT